MTKNTWLTEILEAYRKDTIRVATGKAEEGMHLNLDQAEQEILTKISEAIGPDEKAGLVQKIEDYGFAGSKVSHERKLTNDQKVRNQLRAQIRKDSGL